MLLLLLACDPDRAPAAPAEADSVDAEDSAEVACVPETCNGLDDDCDGAVDEDPTDGVKAYPDADGDGFGGGASPVEVCAPGPRQATADGDCDDADAVVNPGAAEVCNNGRDDNCDGSPNGCELAGTVEAEWAPVRVVLGEEDWLGGDLDAGDVDGDGWVDLYTPAWLPERPLAMAAGFRGPFLTDTLVAEAYADYGCSRASWIEDLRLLDDLDGDGQGEVAVQYTIDSPQPPPPWFYYSWSWMELYSGAPGSVRACDSGSDGPDVWDVVTGRFEDDRALLVASCADGAGWCGYPTPFRSMTPSFVIEAAWYGHGEHAADLDGDGLDELIYGAVEGVEVLWGPVGSAVAPSVRCQGDWNGSYDAVAGAGDVSGDGLPDVLVQDTWSAVSVYAGLADGAPCALDDAFAVVRPRDPELTFGWDAALVGDLDADGTEDWYATLEGEDDRMDALVFLALGAGTHEAEASARVHVRGVEVVDVDRDAGGPAGDGAFALLLEESGTVGVFTLSSGF